jgi:hypothetical protein
MMVLYVLVLLRVWFGKYAKGLTDALGLLPLRGAGLTGQLAHRKVTIPRPPL